MVLRVAKTPEEVWPCDLYNQIYGISIPEDMWPRVFRLPLQGDPKVSGMVAKDDLVMASGVEGKFKVIKVIGPVTTSGDGINLSNEKRPAHYSIACVPAELVYPDKKDIRFFYDLVVSSGKIATMWKKSKFRIYVVRRGKVGQIIDKYRRLSGGIEAAKPEDVFGSSELNKEHKIVIPPKRVLWLQIFRFTKQGEKTVKKIVNTGDIIECNQLHGRYKVVGIEGPVVSFKGARGVEKRPPSFNLVLCRMNVKNPKKKITIPELVAVGGEILSLYVKNNLRISVVKKGEISEILEKWGNK